MDSEISLCSPLAKLPTASLNGQQAAKTQTDVNGAYSLSGLTADTYVVQASKTGFTFEPATVDVTVGPNAINTDFVAFEVYTASYRSGLAFTAFPVDPANDDIVAVLGTDRIARWDPTRPGATKLSAVRVPKLASSTLLPWTSMERTRASRPEGSTLTVSPTAIRPDQRVPVTTSPAPAIWKARSTGSL